MDFPFTDPALEEVCLDNSHHLLNLTPSPNPEHEPAQDANLRPVNSTAFKREARKKRRERKRLQKLEEKLDSLLALESYARPSGPAILSNIEWPCKEINADPNPEPSVWTISDPNQQPAPPPSAEEQVRIASLQAQQNVLKQCQDLFSTNDDSDDEDEEDDMGESGCFKFFVELFEKDGDLRGFYEKNWEKGEFCCLVCGGIGAKLGKRYVNCVGLVQHANTVSKTKRRRGHRAFARAVCKILGWDIDKLPAIFDRQSLAKDGARQEQIGIIEEVQMCKLVGTPIWPQKEDLMDYAEADANTD